MHRMNMPRLDLNLLVVFAAVARTGSVTRAAQDLALSQPAVSHALARLRAVTGDPLFVRSGGELVPTSRALRMAQSVPGVLQAAQALLQDSDFEPATASRNFRIAVSDYAAMALAPGLTQAFRAGAPGCRLEMLPVGPSSMEALGADDFDAMFWGAGAPPPQFESLRLFDERFVGLVAASHPLAKAHRGKPALKEYLAYPHARVSLLGGGQSPVDEALAKRGKQRNIVITTPGFASILPLLATGELIASVPERLAACLPEPQLFAFRLPFPVPRFSYRLVWHRRRSSDPAHMWLRNLVASVSMSKLPNTD